MNTRLLPLGALALLPLIAFGRAPDPLAGERDLSTLVPASALAYVEAPGLSALLESGLEHPLAVRLLDAGIEGLIAEKQGMSSGELLRTLDAAIGIEVLPTLSRLSSRGAALGVALRLGGPKGLLIVRGDDAQLWEDTLDLALDLAATRAGYPGAFAVPADTHQGADLWRIGEELALARRDATFFASNDEGLLREALDLAAKEDALGLGGLASFQQARHGRGDGESAPPLLWAWSDLQRVDALTALARMAQGQPQEKNGKPKGGLDKLRAMTANPQIQMILGPGIAALGGAKVASAALTLGTGELGLELHADGLELGAARVLMPGDSPGPAIGAWDGELGNLAAEAVLYRDFGGVFEQRVELFPPETLPGFSKASNNLALFFGGRDLGEDILPHLEPWLRVVARPVAFDVDAAPEIPLPAAAVIARVKSPERMGPTLVSAFQTMIGIVNVDRAQKGLDSLMMQIELAGGTQVTSARFLVPGENDGVDLRYNLVPACALVGDTFVVGTHRNLVADLAQEISREPHRAATTRAERLVLSGPAVASSLEANFDALVMNAVLEEGKTPEKAEADLRGVLAILGLVDRARVEVRYPDESRVSLALKIDLR